MKLINKPFDYQHALKQIKTMKKNGIFSQSCFVLGFPGETDEDRTMTRELVCDLAHAGISEIALFIITPVPGSKIFKKFSGYKDYSHLNFSPKWREDYKKINFFRLSSIALFYPFHYFGSVQMHQMLFCTITYFTNISHVITSVLLYNLMQF